MTIAYVGMGSNLDNPEQHILTAINDLSLIPGTIILAQAPLYRSAALGPGEQPDYVNSAAKLDTGLPAIRLLEHLMQIEEKHGRVRNNGRWQPRTLDLDLLLYGQRQIVEARLVVPHPEIKNRNFVLCPLCDITPELEIPGVGNVSELLAEIGMSDLERLNQ